MSDHVLNHKFITSEPGLNYDEEYYEYGQLTGKSGYVNFRWLPELTIPMCQRIIEVMEIGKNDTIVDFGCAKGYVVKAFRELKYKAWGCDLSEYAISKADRHVAPYLTLIEQSAPFPYDAVVDYCISKDVFEHIPEDHLKILLSQMAQKCRRLFVVVPLGRNGSYIIEDYENDATHIIREELDWWAQLFLKDFSISLKTTRVPGIKDVWYDIAKDGNGFFILESRALAGK